MRAFISYQTADKLVAGKIKEILSGVGIGAFLAHEDIVVSEEWRLKILEELGSAEIFISLWSAHYYQSPWCMQESGVASYRKEMTIIPLSLDGSIPLGFAGNIQSTRIDPSDVSLQHLLPGIARADVNFAISIMFKSIAGSKSFRGAESRFQPLLPYLNKLRPEQGKQLLEIAAKNSQVRDASLCATEYLPPLLSKFGHLLSPEDRDLLTTTFSYYESGS